LTVYGGNVSKLYRISKTSRGLALWIPARFVEVLGFRPGDRVSLHPQEDGSLLIKKVGEDV